MKKRGSLSLLGVGLVGLLSGCTSYSASPEIKTFLTGLSGKDAYASVQKVSVVESYRSLDKDSSELGKLSSTYEMDKSGSSFYWHRINLYSGDQLKNGIVRAEYLLKKVGEDYHTYIVTNDDRTALQDLTISNEKASDLIRDLIYTPQDSYDAGGLYYGDIFKVNTNHFPGEAFKLNTQENTLKFDYAYESDLTKDDGSSEKLDSIQKITINATGLVTTSYELLRVVSSGAAGENTLNATYNQDFSELSAL